MDPFFKLDESYKNYYGTRGVFDSSDILEKYLLSDGDSSPVEKYEEIIASGFLYCCGLNNYGQLGDNTIVNRSSPNQIPGSMWIRGSCGIEHTVAVKSDGTLWSWGKNDVGQLGLGDSINRSSPTQIPGNSWKDVISTSGGNHNLALKTDGTLWAWGFNDNGQLGINDKLTRFSPVQIPGNQWSKLSIGREFSGCLKSDGSFWVWGLNSSGQLGDNTLSSKSSPVQIGGYDWVSVGRYGGDSNAAIKTDRNLWTWGSNQYGALGQFYGPFGFAAALSSPTQILGHVAWNLVGGGGHHIFASKNDGTYWGWGNNSEGQSGVFLAQSTVEYPVQGRNFNILNASGGLTATYILEEGNVTKSVGINTNGNLGVFDRTSRSSPVQMPGQGWISGGGYHVLSISPLNYNMPSELYK